MHIFLLSRTDYLRDALREAIEKETAAQGNRIAYISSEPQIGEKLFYQSTIQDYSVINPNAHVDYFDLSDAFSDNDLSALKEYGTIYLSGGNTFMFMDMARGRNLYPILKAHGENGGLLIGASAGALMMTPSISLAAVADENTPGLTDLSGFSFADFEFHPHYIGSAEENDFLRAHRDAVKTLYACKDGDGVFYSNGEIKIFGDVSVFMA